MTFTQTRGVAVMVSPVLWSEGLPPPLFLLLFPPPTLSPPSLLAPFHLLFKCFGLFLMKKQSWSTVILFREEV